jgi:hypothetical protein
VQREGARREDFRCQPEAIHAHAAAQASKVGRELCCNTTELSDIDFKDAQKTAQPDSIRDLSQRSEQFCNTIKDTDVLPGPMRDRIKMLLAAVDHSAVGTTRLMPMRGSSVGFRAAAEVHEPAASA